MVPLAISPTFKCVRFLRFRAYKTLSGYSGAKVPSTLSSVGSQHPAVNRKVGGSSPPECELLFDDIHIKVQEKN